MTFAFKTALSISSTLSHFSFTLWKSSTFWQLKRANKKHLKPQTRVSRGDKKKKNSWNWFLSRMNWWREKEWFRFDNIGSVLTSSATPWLSSSNTPTMRKETESSGEQWCCSPPLPHRVQQSPSPFAHKHTHTHFTLSQHTYHSELTIQSMQPWPAAGRLSERLPPPIPHRFNWSTQVQNLRLLSSTCQIKLKKNNNSNTTDKHVPLENTC